MKGALIVILIVAIIAECFCCRNKNYNEDIDIWQKTNLTTDGFMAVLVGLVLLLIAIFLAA